MQADGGEAREPVVDAIAAHRGYGYAPVGLALADGEVQLAHVGGDLLFEGERNGLQDACGPAHRDVGARQEHVGARHQHAQSRAIGAAREILERSGFDGGLRRAIDHEDRFGSILRTLRQAYGESRGHRGVRWLATRCRSCADASRLFPARRARADCTW